MAFSLDPGSSVKREFDFGNGCCPYLRDRDADGTTDSLNSFYLGR